MRTTFASRAAAVLVLAGAIEIAASSQLSANPRNQIDRLTFTNTSSDTLPAVDLSRLTPLRLSYRVTAQGNPVGTQIVTLAREGTSWVRTDSVSFGPTQQILVSRWSADFSAVSHSESLAGPMSGQASVQVAAGRVTGESHLPPQAGGEKTFDAAAAPGMVFDGQDEAALAVAELRAGSTLSFAIFKVNTGAFGSHSYRVVGVDTVTVAAGTFPAIRLEMTGGQIPMTIWVRQQGLHLPLKYQLQGAPIVVELVREG
jgi:hypothetical protein